MGKVGEGPRITTDMSNVGVSQTPQAESKPPLTLPQLNGILDQCFNFHLGGDVETLTERGSARDTPRQDGAVGNRADGVKNFFKSIGQGISNFFAKIGNAFSSAFEAIKEAISSRVNAPTVQQQAPTGQPQATTPTPPDKQVGNLLDFTESLAKDLEVGYQNYLTGTDDAPPKTRAEFVKSQLPDPPDIDKGIDLQSPAYVGDRIGDVRAQIKDVADPGLNEMRQAVVDRFTEMPTLTIAVDSQFAADLKALDGQASTFLRGNTSYTKLDKFISREAIPFQTIASDVMQSVTEEIEGYSDLANIDGLRMGMSTLTEEQGAAALDVADKMLEKLLDTGTDGGPTYLGSIPDSYRDFLAERAEEIMQMPGLSPEDRQDAIKMVYINSLFLRGIAGDISTVSAKSFSGNEQVFAIQVSQLTQTFLNGVTTMSKGNDVAKDALQQIIATHQPRLDAFLKAVGMPTVTVAQTPDSQQSVTE